MMATIKAVIFDMDGVLADSEPIHRAAEKLILKDLDVEYTDDTTGIRFEDVLNEISSKNGIRLDVNMIMGRKFNIMIKNCKQLEPIYHAIQLVDSVKQLKLAVVTGSTKNWADFVLNKFNLHNKFDVIITSEDFKKGKPDPEPYLIAGKRLGIKPESCIVIEDSSAGLRSAKAAGMKCVGLVSPHTTTQDLSKADHIVHDLMEVKRFCE